MESYICWVSMVTKLFIDTNTAEKNIWRMSPQICLEKIMWRFYISQKEYEICNIYENKDVYFENSFLKQKLENVIIPSDPNDMYVKIYELSHCEMLTV